MKKIITTAVVALSLAFTSCGDYLDINESPNSPNVGSLSPGLIFPGAEMALCNVYGDYLRITGGYFAEHYSQYYGTTNYMDYSQFRQSSVRCDRAYTQLSRNCLGNMATVREMAETNEEWGTYLAATVMRAIAYESMVDCWGEIPYSEALDMNNLSPKYDNGIDVYAGIIAEIDAALEKVSAGDPVCTNMLSPGSAADYWIAFANAIKLRMLMRESYALDVKSQIAALIAEDNFPAEDIAWQGFWGNSSSSQNPFYTEEFMAGQQKNLILNIALCATMQACDDPRIESFFEPNSSKGEYTGGVSGTNFSTTASYKANYWCRPAIKNNSPVYIITVAEIEFFKAEYEARYGSASAAEAHYKAAIEASYATAGVNGSIDTVLNVYPYDQSNYRKCIGIQKWVALSGVNNFEAYCELRRLGYPTFGSVSGSDIYNVVTDSYNPAALQPGELYTPITVNTKIGDNALIQRWPYPESSANRNQNVPEFPGESVPVFWAGK
jgi:hypothetical protein